MEFKILEILFDSSPIIGPIDVEGLPFSGSILIRVKPIENVTSYFEASTLYIFSIFFQLCLKTKSTLFLKSLFITIANMKGRNALSLIVKLKKYIIFL